VGEPLLVSFHPRPRLLLFLLFRGAFSLGFLRHEPLSLGFLSPRSFRFSVFSGHALCFGLPPRFLGLTRLALCFLPSRRLVRGDGCTNCARSNLKSPN
jgi:hypothetical protein